VEDLMDSPGVLLRKHGLHPKKHWGQNFLSDSNVQERIAQLVHPRPGDVVVELGSGLGHLTSHLVGHGARVIGVERDRELAPVLREELGSQYPELEIREADAVSLDLNAISREAGQRLIVCGNLPYHLGSPILFNVLDNWHSVRRLVVMLQKEVVERIVAAPDTEDYGLLSVLLQQIADVQLGMRVPSGAFVPPPAVDSAVLVAEIRETPLAAVTNEALFRKVVKAAFSMRRKTLTNALRHVASKEILAQAFQVAQIDPVRRGETLSVAEFARIEQALAAQGVKD
jgi:16S rRNA (adenine1518-N6/adenine1519-N6)-dimethyltransferase